MLEGENALDKVTLRQQIGKALAALSSEERKTASAQAIALLQKQEVWADAEAVLFYAPLPAELDIWPLVEVALNSGKQAFLPRFDAELRSYEACAITDPSREVESGRFGIREPVQSCAALRTNRLDLILVPGIAFDLQGRRLGRGKGYYDRLLGFLRGKTCGVAFDQQIVRAVPVEPHDVHLNCILTPTRWSEL